MRSRVKLIPCVPELSNFSACEPVLDSLWLELWQKNVSTFYCVFCIITDDSSVPLSTSLFSEMTILSITLFPEITTVRSKNVVCGNISAQRRNIQVACFGSIFRQCRQIRFADLRLYFGNCLNMIDLILRQYFGSCRHIILLLMRLYFGTFIC